MIIATEWRLRAPSPHPTIAGDGIDRDSRILVHSRGPMGPGGRTPHAEASYCPLPLPRVGPQDLCLDAAQQEERGTCVLAPPFRHSRLEHCVASACLSLPFCLFLLRHHCGAEGGESIQRFLSLPHLSNDLPEHQVTSYLGNQGLALLRECRVLAKGECHRMLVPSHSWQ